MMETYSQNFPFRWLNLDTQKFLKHRKVKVGQISKINSINTLQATIGSLIQQINWFVMCLGYFL